MHEICPKLLEMMMIIARLSVNRAYSLAACSKLLIKTLDCYVAEALFMTLRSISDGAFCENIKRLKEMDIPKNNYFDTRTKSVPSVKSQSIDLQYYWIVNLTHKCSIWIFNFKHEIAFRRNISQVKKVMPELMLEM